MNTRIIQDSMSQIQKAANYLSQGLNENMFNWFLNCFPDNLFINARLRPFIARVFGMHCGKNCMIKKRVFIEFRKNIVLGDGVLINRFAYLDAYGGITLEKNVRLGPHIMMITGSHQIGGPEMRTGAVVGAPIKIGEGCWLGARVLIFPGVSIGGGSVVSAGAVVQRSMPGGVLISGNPARPVSRLVDSPGGSIGSGGLTY